MKMLCIKGQTHSAHTGLFSGVVYDVTFVPCPSCHHNSIQAEGSVFHRPKILTCNKCGASKKFVYVPWGRFRFIPFNPDELKVTAGEVRKLYSSKPIKELV